MAFKYMLTTEEIREKIIEFARVKDKVAYVRAKITLNNCERLNWGYGLYDGESGMFLTLKRDEKDPLEGRGVLITGDGEVVTFCFTTNRFRIIKTDEQIEPYREIIESTLKTYFNEEAINGFLQGLSDKEKEELIQLKDKMIDRCKMAEEIKCFEDAKRLLIKEKYFQDNIDDCYNHDTVENYHKYMSEEQRRRMCGEGFRENLNLILSYGDVLTDDEYEIIHEAYRNAANIYREGSDDLYADKALEVVKKAKKISAERRRFSHFMVCYINGSIRLFIDRIKELKEFSDYINENFTKEFAEEWHYFGEDLSRLVNGGTIGFKFVLSTDEIRDIIFDFLYAGSMLKKPFVNWVTGVYDKEAGIFMTQIFGTPPGREVSISMNKYIVLKVGEPPFMVTGIVDKSTCEWTCSVPKEYDYLADKLEEGIRMCDYDRMYRMNLPKVDKDYIGEIIDKMKERIAATEGSN